MARKRARKKAPTSSAALNPEPRAPATTPPSLHERGRSSNGPSLAGEAFWSGQSEPDRLDYLKQIDACYHAIVDEFFELSNVCVQRFQAANASHVTWRQRMIWLTGSLAALNVLVAYFASLDRENSSWPYVLLRALPLIAAVYATFIAIISSLENLHRYHERAQGFREARDLLLGATRRYEMLWHTSVRPYRTSATACAQAEALYARIVAEDDQVRAQVKELTTKDRAPAAGGAEGN